MCQAQFSKPLFLSGSLILVPEICPPSLLPSPPALQDCWDLLSLPYPLAVIFCPRKVHILGHLLRNISSPFYSSHFSKLLASLPWLILKIFGAFWMFYMTFYVVLKRDWYATSCLILSEWETCLHAFTQLSFPWDVSDPTLPV